MYISIDIGGTSIRIASSPSLGDLDLSIKIEFFGTHSYESDYSKIVEEIGKRSKEIKGIGIGIPGDISKDKRIVMDTSWNHEWEGRSFVDNLAKEFDCPVHMDNDAVVAALGVEEYGEGKGKEFAYVTWGSGMGGANVTRSGEKVISTKLDWDEYFAEWEEKCGGKKMENNYGKTGDKLTEKDWESLMEDFQDEIDKFINKLNPKMIIFGGGISTKQKSRLLGLKSDTEVKVSLLGENTGLYGGFALIKSFL